MLGAAAAPLVAAWPLLAPSRASLVARDGLLAMAWLLVVIVAALARRGPQGRPLAVVGVTVFGAAYAGWLLSFALALRHPAPGLALSDARIGMALLVFPLALTWLGDTSAMAAGKAIGGPKLAPVVSPNKTWAGSAAGLLTSVVASLAYAALVFPRVGIAVAAWEALVLGVAISVAGQVGDLAESVFKREVGMKDSSSLIPGHGGVLDRLDALYFAVPVTALLLHVLGIA